MLSIQQLSKQFESQMAVNQLSFEVGKGQVFGLLGRNGAGKSTTIKMILGLVKPSGGEITWNGVPIEQANVRIGYLPEERGLYTKSKVGDMLTYFGKLEGMGTKEVGTAIDYWLNRLEIPEYKTKLVADLSKGNQQKIQLIATLLHDPELVILDEPFSGLDPVNSQVFAIIIEEEIAKGKTVIMSSHRMDMVEAFVEEVTLLKQGNAMVSGSLQAIKDSYQTRNLILGASAPVTEHFKQQGIDFSIDKQNVLVKVADDSVGLNVLNGLAKAGIRVPEFKLLQPTLEEIFIERVG
ncbi:MAG: ATP-binding cassette domain-containing protein [Turicibacter sp.]|nr:ATP-binding cassette domain-containing protein [Turicibacter sp.]